MFLSVINLQELKQMCEESLCTNINTDNVLGKILVFISAIRFTISFNYFQTCWSCLIFTEPPL